MGGRSSQLKMSVGGESKVTSNKDLQVEDNEDVICMICQDEYDLDLRLPKMLDCPHSVCLPCLKVLFIYLYIVLSLSLLTFFFIFCHSNILKDPLNVPTNVNDLLASMG